VARREAIDNDFLMNDRIWPPGITPPNFVTALVEVRTRLPDDAYDSVSDLVTFVAEDPQITTVNVPFYRDYPPSPSGRRIRFDTIMDFHPALAYPHAALVGLLAHELAHSIVSASHYKAVEQNANEKALRWGFGMEIEALRIEQAKDNKGS